MHQRFLAIRSICAVSGRIRESEAFLESAFLAGIVVFQYSLFAVVSTFTAAPSREMPAKRPLVIE